MPKRLINEIRLSQLGNYQIWEEDAEGLPYSRHDIEPDTEPYFTWLSGLRSFHFEGKEGRFTARLESRKNKDGSTREYWSAYRKHNHKQLRRYLGQTSNLTIATLEAAAQYLVNVCTSQPVKAPTPRKKPIPRSVLLAQIADRDRAIERLVAQRDETVARLEARIVDLELQLIRCANALLGRDRGI